MNTINNAKLQNCFKLSSKVTVYVPATNGVSEATDNTEQVKKTASLLAGLFGGSTSCRGYHRSFRLCRLR